MIDNHPDAVYGRLYVKQARSLKKWRIKKIDGWWCGFRPYEIMPHSDYERWESAANAVRYWSNG